MNNKEDSIGKIKLDYTFYSEQSDRSDDSVADELLEIVKQNDKKSYGKAIIEHKNWSVLYHLSPFRENIIVWYPMDKNSKVLEIGSECGALTGALCEKAGTVQAVDSSYKYSLVNTYRNKDRDNLRISVGDIRAFLEGTNEKYDIITLIGGVPYSEKLLALIKPHLNAGGKILITVNNKIGLRYLAGYEDNRDTRMTKKALATSIAEQGFRSFRFFYPYPDACLTDVIFSDDRLPHKGELNENIRNFDKKRFVFFDEASAYNDIIDNNDFASFSNSFLVSIGEEEDEQIIYAKISDSRDYRFQIITELYKTKTGVSVRKINKLPEGYEWLKTIKANENKLNKAFKNKVRICPSTLIDSYLEFDFIEGDGMDKELKSACSTCDTKSIIDVLDKYYEIIRYMKTDDNFTATEEFKVIFGEPSLPETSESGNIVNIDLLFSNIIRSNGTDTIIDYEWVFDFPIPLEFVFWRGLTYSCEIASLDSKIRNEIFTHYGLTYDKLDTYRKMEDSFQAYVYGDMVRRYDYSRVIPIEAFDVNKCISDNQILMADKQTLITDKKNLEAYIEDLKNELNSIRSSKSWKILRFFKIVKG